MHAHDSLHFKFAGTGLPKNFKLERFIEILSPLEREEINRAAVQKQKTSTNCLVHTNKSAEYYCTTCSVLVCGDCLVEKHMNHEVKRAAKILPQRLETLKGLIPVAKEVLSNGETSLRTMEECSESLVQQGIEAARHIDTYLDKLRSILTTRGEELKSGVAELVETGQKKIELNRLALENCVEEVRVCMQEFEQAVDTESVDILLKEEQLKSRLLSGQQSLKTLCKTTTTIKTLAIKPPPLEDIRLEVLCSTLAAKPPIPSPRKKQSGPDRPAYYTLPPAIKRLEEVDECESPPESVDRDLVSPPPPLRKESYFLEPIVVEPDLVWGPKLLSSTFFHSATASVYPRGVCCGAEGTVIITDVQNHCFRILAPTGKCLEVIGREGRSDGQFGEPTSVTADYEGNLFVCDLGPARVQKFSLEGIYISLSLPLSLSLSLSLSLISFLLTSISSSFSFFSMSVCNTVKIWGLELAVS